MHLINFESDQWHVARATSLKEENKLIEAGFEYVHYSDKDKSPYTADQSGRTGLKPNLSSITQSSGSIARLSIPAFRAGDPGPNPGRSTNLLIMRAQSAIPNYVNLILGLSQYTLLLTLQKTSQLSSER